MCCQRTQSVSIVLSLVSRPSPPIWGCVLRAAFGDKGRPSAVCLLLCKTLLTGASSRRVGRKQKTMCCSTHPMQKNHAIHVSITMIVSLQTLVMEQCSRVQQAGHDRAYSGAYSVNTVKPITMCKRTLWDFDGVNEITSC